MCVTLVIYMDQSKATCNREVTLENIFLGEVLMQLWSCFLQGSGREREGRTGEQETALDRNHSS